MKLSKILFILLVLSLIGHCLAAFIFIRVFPQLSVPSKWFGQSLVAIAVSAGLSVLIFLFRKRDVRLVLLFFHCITVTIVGIPQGNLLELEYILFSLLILELAFYLPQPFHIGAEIGIVLIAVLLQKPFHAWGVDLPPPQHSVIIVYGFYLVLLTFVAVLSRRAITHLHDTTQENQRLFSTIQKLIDANIGFQKYARSIEEKSADNERKRITREIHDTVGYAMINIMMMSQDALLLTHNNNGELTKLHKDIRDQAQEGLNETRRALQILRDSDTIQLPLLNNIIKLTDAFREATGITIHIEFGNLPHFLNNKISSIIYRMVQEGMTNSLQHGGAKHIFIHFWQNNSELMISIRDDGKGVNNYKEGIGLSGMRERFESVGGGFTAANVVDGFEVTATIPNEWIY